VTDLQIFEKKFLVVFSEEEAAPFERSSLFCKEKGERRRRD